MTRHRLHQRRPSGPPDAGGASTSMAEATEAGRRTATPVPAVTVG